MQGNINGELSNQKNKIVQSLDELMDDLLIENNNNSEIYEEYGDKQDMSKQIENINGVSAGRYTNNYIHYIMRNEDLENFITVDRGNKGKKAKK